MLDVRITYFMKWAKNTITTIAYDTSVLLYETYFISHQPTDKGRKIPQNLAQSKTAVSSSHAIFLKRADFNFSERLLTLQSFPIPDYLATKTQWTSLSLIFLFRSNIPYMNGKNSYIYIYIYLSHI